MKILSNHRFIKAFASLLKAALCVLMLGSLLVNVHAMDAPDTVVKNTVDRIVANIQSNRSDYRSNPAKLYAMVENTLVPAIHVDRMSGLILGNSARGATDAQKKAFANEFKTFLIRSYATALLDYTGDQAVNYQPINLASGEDKVNVTAELVASDGQKYPIILYMSNRSDTSWRAYNMEVAGINLVSTYRANFGGIIAQKGVDGLIADLKQKNAKLAS